MSAQSIAELPGAFTHAQALSAGVSDRDLVLLRDAGTIERLARGIYARPNLEADPNLIEIAVRSPDATLCLTSALAHHDLTDDIPHRINVALPRSRRAPRTTAPVQWHRFDDDTFGIGRAPHTLTEDISIGVYSPTRSVIDAYRLRHLYGTDQAHGALKRWLRTSGTQPSDLLKMVKSFPKAEPAVRSALEILL